MGTIAWQLFGREGSGSILLANSGSRGLMDYWLDIDYWLMAAGVVTLPIAFFFRRLRVAAFALLISLLMLVRSGYLPYPYITGLLPFAALVFAGVLHYLLIAPTKARGITVRGTAARIAIIILAAGTIVFVAPEWQTKLSAVVTEDRDASSRQTVEWIDKNVSRDSLMVVESALWTDLQGKGFNNPDPVWLYKTETDPEVVADIGGWPNIDYIVLNGPTVGAPDFGESFPTVSEAIKNAELVTEFGKDNQKVLIYKVKH
jgi:hypothetical protein